tara:strand:- start:9 stop:377 length:369 start_codon:yes stop_codon:yes gene_type:complete
MVDLVIQEKLLVAAVEQELLELAHLVPLLVVNQVDLVEPEWQVQLQDLQLQELAAVEEVVLVHKVQVEQVVVEQELHQVLLKLQEMGLQILVVAEVVVQLMIVIQVEQAVRELLLLDTNFSS